MKKIILFIVITLFFTLNQTFAAQSDTAPLYWEWKLKLDTNWVILFSNTVWDIDHPRAYLSNDNYFHGFFWISSSQINEYCSFDWIDSTNKAKLTLISWDLYKMSWFAFCEKSWWITFDSKDWNHTTYNKSTWTFWGFAWSKALWWMSLQWVEMDITPPTIDTSVFMANNLKPLSSIISDNWSYPWSYIIEVEKWDSDSNLITLNLSNSHNFQKAKNYTIKVTDPSWNYSEGEVQVIANLPNKTPTLSTTTWVDIYANWNDAYKISLDLSDEYWNPLINIANWIRNIEVTATFNNQLYANQLDNSQAYNSAISLFWSIHKPHNSTDISSYSGPLTTVWWDWKYEINITSLAPTKAWNNIKLESLSYNITSYITAFEDTKSYISTTVNQELNFKSLLEVTSTNNNDWLVNIGTPLDFETTITKTWNLNIDEFYLYHLMDLWFFNLAISIQDIVNTSWNNYYWVWYNKTTNTSSVSWYEYFKTTEKNDFKLENSESNIIYKNSYFPNTWTTYKFSWTPKVIYWAPAEAGITYSSIIEYIIGTKVFKYNSLTTSASSAIVDNVLKVWWALTDSDSVFERTSWSNYLKITNELNKPEVKAMVEKNVVRLTAWLSNWDTENWIYYKEWEYTLSSWSTWVETIIIKWWDLNITKDIAYNLTQMKWIIVLEDENWNWWNIYIDRGVKNISAVIYADKSVISWEPNWTFYSNQMSATSQLYVRWSIISNNTVWWADMVPYKCPYNITCNNFEEAKRYDFNYFRNYIETMEDWINDNNIYDPAVNVPAWDQKYAFIINYDSRIQTNPPKGFTK